MTRQIFTLLLLSTLSPILHAKELLVHYAYDDKTVPLADTALIRPATRSEKLEEKVPLKSRLFLDLNKASRSIAGIQSFLRVDPNNPKAKPKQLFLSTSLRVLPGDYSLVVACGAGQILLLYDVTIEAKAGYEYLLECRSKEGHETYMDVRERPFAN